MIKNKSIFVFSVLMTVLISCLQSTNEPIEQVTGKPGIYFKEKVHDFGKIDYKSDGTHKFKFQNNGDQPLTINNVRTSCGCTVPQYSKEPFMSGAEGEIKVKYDTKRVGRFEKNIFVYTNASEDPVLLRIKGNVKNEEDIE